MRKTKTGTVVSVAMKKTAVVEVVARAPHPLYKKLMKKSKRYKVDTARVSVTVGDKVRIVEIRPLAKDKYFAVEEVLTKKEQS